MYGVGKDFAAESGEGGLIRFREVRIAETGVLQSAVEVGDNAFENCKEAKQIILPQAERIGDNVFGFCEDLEYVTMPSLKKIGASPFTDCKNLKVLTLGENPPGFQPRSFEGAAKDGLTLIVPDASKYGTPPVNMPAQTQVHE